MTPKGIRSEFFKALHHGKLGGHQGVNKTLAQLKTRYYWPRMREDVQLWCARCHKCGETKPMMLRKKSALCQTRVGAPFEKTAIDLMGPFAKSHKGNVYVVVIQDYFTKWVVAEGIRDKTSMTVADVLYTSWITKFGCLRQLHSDQGGEFTSALFREMCSRLRIDKTVTSAYRPQSDGLVERSNRSLQSMLRAYVNTNRNDWDERLPAIVCAYCATPQESTGISPYRMLYGREMDMPIDIQYDTGARKETPLCETAYAEWLVDSMRRGHDMSRVQMGKAAKRQKRAYQERTRDVQFRRGDWVWRSYPQLQPGKL